MKDWRFGIVLLVTIVAVAMLLLTLPGQVRPVAAFPPRPTPITPQPPTPKPVTGGTIILDVQEAPEDVLTVVQWQDGDGVWHDVEGWRGPLNETGRIAWWVAPDDMGTGPFRWVVYEVDSNDEWAISGPFDLPERASKKVHVILP